MRLVIAALAALLPVPSVANAQIQGVAVQVSSGKRIPTVEQLQIVLRPGDFVRDILGWGRVDLQCDLRGNPAAKLKIPSAMATLYANVQAAGGKNFVTLAFNNRFCGQAANSGATAFPDTPMLVEEFAAYAAAVARQVPALGGVSIWNELDGSWGGGYSTDREKLTHYCVLSNAVITAIRNVNPTLPIAIGATVGGGDIGSWFVDMFDTYGCVGKGDPTIWLDVHPYLSGTKLKSQRKLDWTLWANAVGQIRMAGIPNLFAATEWGGKSYSTWLSHHPGGNYITEFQNRVTAQDSHWAAFIWFEMLYDRALPNASLFDKSGNLTAAGAQYVGFIGN